MLTRIAGAAYLSNVETTQPATEPITLAEFKKHARIDGNTEDSDLTIKLLAARLRVEDLIGSPLISRQFRLRLDSFPVASAITLPAYPVTAITSLEYYFNGVWSVFSSAFYALDSDSSPARVLLQSPANWPTVDFVGGLSPTVSVVYSAGYASAALVPAQLKMAVLMLATYWYANRETADVLSIAEVPQACDVLCATYKRTRWAI